MKKNHDCQDVVTQFNLLLDGALNAKEEQDVMCELQRCLHCLEEYNLEEKYRVFIREKFDKKNCSESLVQRIKDCCKGE